MAFYLTPKQDDFNKFLNCKSATARHYTMSFRLWRTQVLTQKDNWQPYTVRFSRISNRRGSYQVGVRISSSLPMMQVVMPYC